jgi:hypothetical protein
MPRICIISHFFHSSLGLGYSLVLATCFSVLTYLHPLRFGMQRSCLQEAVLILKVISICKERQVTSNEVRQYVLPSLQSAFQESQSACEIYKFACSLGQMPAEFEASLNLLSIDGRRCLGDIVLREDFKRGQGSEHVRSMSSWLLPDCPCFTQTCLELVTASGVRRGCCA